MDQRIFTQNMYLPGRLPPASENRKRTKKDRASKKRGPPKGYVEGLESRLKRMEKLLMNIATNNGNLPNETSKTAQSAEQSRAAASADSDSVGEDYSHASGSDTKEDDDEEQEQDAEEAEMEAYKTACKQRGDEPFSYVGSSSGIYLLSRLFPKENSILRPDASEVLPRPLEGHEDDLMIARFNGDNLDNFGFGRKYDADWKLPPKELTDYLVYMYFKRFNPILPIIDQDQFYENYKKKSYHSTFIAIIMTLCRVTCRLLKKDDALVKKYKIDRGSLYHDISKQLDRNFDLDFLEPKIETIQVLLLNAANAAKWGLESTDWITTSIAVKMAQDLGLHRANTQHEGIPKKDTEAKKRLWWSAYVIDRVVCASLGRPLTISDADCDVEYPDAEDSTYAQFTHLVKLTCILGDILRALCSPRARIMSSKGAALENISRNLEKMLLEWKQNLPDDLNLTDKELSLISGKQMNPELQTKLNGGAGKLRLAYCAVYLLSKRPFISMGTENDSNVKMPNECQETLKTAVELFEVIDPTNLLCFWSISTFCLSQTQINIDANTIAESKSLSERFQQRHRALEDYITEKSLIPFLSMLSKVIADDEPAQNKNDEAIIDQQTSLWSASSGIEWQEMVKLLSETGYNL
ncbi:hypothetical protein MFLAVUS_006357 [Mucor flavus]|uniref:Xylanolytic transcriptional activator regulatory domain-containing protein n=1 Tax=Mucor flavus TaxID=439312 RepID=A0ABP9Z1A7_9FUNG